MNPWKHLTHGPGTDFERLLLDSARSDAAPLASRQHVAARLGIDLARIEASAALHPAPAQDAVRIIQAALEPARAGALVKCTLIAVIGGLFAANATSEVEVIGASMAMAEVHAAEVAPPVLLEAAPAAMPNESTAAENTPKPAAANLARPQGPRARKPVPAASVAASDGVDGDTSAADPLLLEVSHLDRVRAALGSGRTLEALRVLDAYETRFPRGALQLEAAVLRVRTLERAGRFAHAARLARAALELPGSKRYRAELTRVGGSEGTRRDKGVSNSTLREPR